MSINHSLFIKYGLNHNPTEQEIEQWASLVEVLIRSGIGKEAAGERAAEQVFPDFNTMVYASEADTIEALLAAARNRGSQQRGR